MTYRPPTLQTLVLTAVFAASASAIMALSRPIEMRVDGQRVVSDVPPVTTAADRIYVPLRSVADALGAQTVIDGDRIEVIRGTQTLRVRLGDPHATLNGAPMTLKHAPFRVRGRVMLGLKAVTQAFGVRAIYDPRTARIDVVTSGVGAATTTQPPPTQ